jgi:hypothetical protein
MEKILIGLLFVGLNTGTYTMFVLDERLNVSKRLKKIFFSFFAVASIFCFASGSQDLRQVGPSIFLLLVCLIGLSMYKFFFSKFFEQKGTAFPQTIKKIVVFGLLPVYSFDRDNYADTFFIQSLTGKYLIFASFHPPRPGVRHCWSS